MSVKPADALNPIQPDFAFFQHYAEKSDFVFWAADPVSYQLIYVSPHAENLLGVPLAEWKQPLFWQTYLHDADRERVLAAFNTTASTQKTLKFEYRLIHSDGSQLWFRDSVCVLSTPDGQFLCGMMTDVTIYKTAVNHETEPPGFESLLLDVVTMLAEDTRIVSRLNRLAEKLCKIFELTAVSILEWNPALSQVEELAQFPANFSSPLKRELNRAESIDALIVNQPLLINEQNVAMPSWQRTYLHQAQAKTILLIPLPGKDQTMGCIELISAHNEHAFTKHEIKFTQILAKQTANAISKEYLSQAEATRRREAEILLDVSEFVSSSLDQNETLDRVLGILRVYLTDAHHFAISLISKDKTSLETILSWSAEDNLGLFNLGEAVPINETFTAQLALNSGEPIVISDLQKVPFVNEYTAEMMTRGLRAILSFPLKVQNRLLGILQIHYWNQPRQFTPEEIALLQGVTNHLAVGIENARLFENERRQLHLAQTLQQVGALLTTSLSLEQVYEQVFNILSQVVAYDSTSIFLYDKSFNRFRLVASRGIEINLWKNSYVALSADVVLDRFSQAQSWKVFSDAFQNESWSYSSKSVSEPIRGWIGALLLVKDEVVGMLNVDSLTANSYSDEDGRMVAAFANQAAVAIENARLYDETMRQTKELALLNRVSEETAVSLNIDHFIENITATLRGDLFPHMAGFVMFDPETQTLEAHGSYYGLTEELKRLPIPLEQSIVGQATLTGQPYYAPNVFEDPYYNQIKEDTLSEIAVPLKVNNQVIGIINLESPEFDAFTNQDRDFLMTLASTIAAVLERASLYQTLQIQADSLAEQVAQQTVELQLERDRLFAILESAGEAILLVNTESQILYANPAMEQQSGYSREELKMKETRFLGSGLQSEATAERMWRTVRGNKRWSGEYINKHKDGHFYDVAVTMTPIVNAAGEITGFVSVHSDITRLKEIERLKTEFIANASHQLRTPLTSIKTFVSLLEKGKPEKFPRYFSILHTEIDRLAQLIQDLLDISRLDTEISPSPDAVTDFCDFWQEFWHPLVEQAARRNRTLQPSMQQMLVTKAPKIFMEPYHLEKILSRLAANEIAYANENGIIQATAVWHSTDNGNTVMVKISDDGPGIPQNELPFIFDRFYRGSRSVEIGLLGHGLGLAIVKELLAQYGGKIFLESEKGKGSCFTLQFPIKSYNTQISDADGST